MLTKDKSFYKTFVSLALALMMQQAVVLSVNLADNVMLGSYSEISLSGVAAVNQIQFILQQQRFIFRRKKLFIQRIIRKSTTLNHRFSHQRFTNYNVSKKLFTRSINRYETEYNKQKIKIYNNIVTSWIFK